MAGRKTKLTPELIKNAEKLLKGGNYVNTVCEFLGIAERTWYNWYNEGEKGEQEGKNNIKVQFFQSVRKCEAEAEIRLLTDLQKIAESKEDPKPIMWMLERKYPDRWGKQRLEIEHSGSVTNKKETHVSINHQITHDEESRELLMELWRRRVQLQENEER